MAIVAVPGGGAAQSSAALATVTFSLTVAEGDYVVMGLNVGAGQIDPAVVAGPGAGQRTWTYLGNLTVGTASQLWVLENAHAGSGNVTVTVVGRTYIFAVAQVYSGVGARAQVFLPDTMSSAKPAVAPEETSYFNVTVPGSMGVTAFSWPFGTSVGVALTAPRQIMQGAGQTIALKDQLFAATGQQQLLLTWSSTSGTPTHARLSVLFAPIVAPAVQVVISPTSASVTSGAVAQFLVTVTGTPNTAVTWTASPGSIDAIGLYTAPTVFIPTAGTVTATSVADPTKSATAVLNILPAEAILPAAPGGGFRRTFIRSKRRGAIWDPRNYREA